MRRSVYRELTASLLADCRSAVWEFSRSHHNHDVFAFVLSCDPLHGALIIGINTETSLEQVLRERYPKAKRSEVDGLHGIRFRCGDFLFNDFGLSEETMQLLDEIAATQHDALTDRTAERHADMLLVTLARVLLILEPEMEALDQTEDFVTFVREVGAPEESVVTLIRRTVPPERFDRVFPEVCAFEEKLAQVSQLIPEEQAQFWVESARDLAFGIATQDTKRFREMGRTPEDLLDQAAERGSACVATMIDVLEKTAQEPQLHKPKTKAYQQQGPHTSSAALSLQILDRLRSIRLVDEENLVRVQAILKKLHRRNKDKKVGPLAFALAETLHSLRPHIYPEPKGDTTALRNPDAFGLK